MIFSSDPSTEIGQGWIVEFKRTTWGKETLEKAALALAAAEGIGPQTITCGWGAVGVFVKDGGREAERIKTIWKTFFGRHKSDNFTHSKYCFEGQEPVIDESGFLRINSSLERREFDFLMATPTLPNPRRPLSAKAIADRMNQRKYTTYFKKNKAFGISTFQDETIASLLNI